METDLNDTIDKTLMFLNSRITGDIKLVRQYSLDRMVPVFPEKIHQVIMNVLDNALFAVKSLPSGQKTITISTSLKGNSVVLSFFNNGPLISEEHLDQLFDPFFTTKDPGQGTGLGLSICYTLVTEHGGEIKARNLSDGVSFTISLPAS